jgi:hypothetical protein
MITHNVGSIIQAMNRRKGAVVRELTEAARVLGPEVSGECKRILQSEIYDVPIPLKASANRRLGKNAPVRNKTTKGKHGQWSRSGALKRNEGFRVVGPVLILTNNVKYAGPRYRLGTSQGRRIVSAGVRSVQWQEEAISNKRARILEVRRRHVLRALSANTVGG